MFYLSFFAGFFLCLRISSFEARIPESSLILALRSSLFCLNRSAAAVLIINHIYKFIDNMSEEGVEKMIRGRYSFFLNFHEFTVLRSIDLCAHISRILLLNGASVAVLSCLF